MTASAEVMAVQRDRNCPSRSEVSRVSLINPLIRYAEMSTRTPVRFCGENTMSYYCRSPLPECLNDGAVGGLFWAICNWTVGQLLKLMSSSALLNCCFRTVLIASRKTQATKSCLRKCPRRLCDLHFKTRAARALLIEQVGRLLSASANC